MVLKNRYFDIILGSIVSSLFFVPMTGVFVAVFQLSLGPILFISTIIVGIQALFTYLEIYKDNWWGLAHTWFALILAFYTAKAWYRKLNQPVTRFVRFTNLYFALLSFSANIIFIASVFNAYFYKLNWFENLSRGHIAFAGIYSILTSLVLVTLFTLNVKRHWFVATFGLHSLVDYTLYQYGYLILKNWHLGFFILLLLLYYYFLLLFDRLLLMPKKVSTKYKEEPQC